jgi:hypothetical protein
LIHQLYHPPEANLIILKLETVTSSETPHLLHYTARCKNPEDHLYKKLLVYHIKPKLVVETKWRCVKTLLIVEEQLKEVQEGQFMFSVAWHQYWPSRPHIP